SLPEKSSVNTAMLEEPLPPHEAADAELVKGPNIATLPDFEPLPDRLDIPVVLAVGDNISTDEILPAGAKVLPYRSNIPKLAEFAFSVIDDTYPSRATKAAENYLGHAVIAGENYGQGSSREHAAIAPRYLGLRLVIATSFARCHLQNLANLGVLPLEFVNPDDTDSIAQDDVLVLDELRKQIAGGTELTVTVHDDAGGGKQVSLPVRHR